MTNLDALERRYQILADDFNAGLMDQATFVMAVDQLRFEDSWGRYWMIGNQTGDWYCYDGQNWLPGDPRPVETAAVAEPVSAELPLASRPRRPVLTGVLLSLLLALLLLPLLILPVAGAPPDSGLTAAPSPRPPINSNGQGGGGGSNGNGGGSGDGSGPESAIFGTLTDLSTGQPGAGIEVSVSGAVVRTDTKGDYSITGLNAGTYVVSPDLQGQGVSAQAPIFVNLDGQSKAIIDLAYWSESQPLPTDTPQVVSNVPAATPAPAATPPLLPASGAPFNYQPLLFVWLGSVLIVLGSLLKIHVI